MMTAEGLVAVLAVFLLGAVKAAGALWAARQRRKEHEQFLEKLRR